MDSKKFIESLTTEDEFLKDLRKFAKIYHIPIADLEVERFLQFLIKSLRPKKILELGTAVGYSTIHFARNNFVERVLTVEVREDMASIALSNFKKLGLESKIELRLNDAFEELKNLDEEFDLVFIDAAKGQYKYYFDEAVKHLAKGGIIVCDNVLFKGMVADDSKVVRRKITIVRRLREFLNYVFNDERFFASLLDIGDGVLLVRRNDE